MNFYNKDISNFTYSWNTVQVIEVKILKIFKSVVKKFVRAVESLANEKIFNR